MDVLELIRNADSAIDVFQALSVYADSLRDTPFIPEWCLRLPFDGESDVYRRMLALIAVANAAPQGLLGRHRTTIERAVSTFTSSVN